MKKLSLFLFILLIGCKAPQVTTERFYSDTTIITEKLKLVEVPGVSLKSNAINIDSLVAKLKAGIPPSVIERETIYQDPKTGDRVGILIDQFGNLTALCEIQEQMIQVLEKEVLRLIKENEVKTVLVKPNFFQRIKASIDLIVYTTLILLAGLLIMKRFFP
jgi:hypothetical protein